MEIFGSSDHLYNIHPGSLEVWYDANAFRSDYRERSVGGDGTWVDGGWGGDDVRGWSRGRGHEGTSKGLVCGWRRRRGLLLLKYTMYVCMCKKKQVMRIGNHTRNFLTSMRKRVIGVIGSRIGEGMTMGPSCR